MQYHRFSLQAGESFIRQNCYLRVNPFFILCGMKSLIQSISIHLFFLSATAIAQPNILSYPCSGGLIFKSNTYGYYFSAAYDSNGTKGNLVVRLDEQFNAIWQKVLQDSVI